MRVGLVNSPKPNLSHYIAYDSFTFGIQITKQNVIENHLLRNFIRVVLKYIFARTSLPESLKSLLTTHTAPFVPSSPPPPSPSLTLDRCSALDQLLTFSSHV